MVIKVTTAHDASPHLKHTLLARVSNGKCFIDIIHNGELGKLWLSALNARKKSASLRRLGRWLEEKTRAARELNSRSDSLNAVENLSSLF
jgi:hypothetical protein